ncbi:MAG: hypothetical protein M1826_004248 [Phylliscum demangeonii]|nr:MAG: hypothetical protein M1826_004248 [Phylliscum demangeonii]
MTRITPYLLYITLVATLGSLQYGYHLAELNAPAGLITCASPPARRAHSALLPACIPMSRAQFGFVASIFTCGGLVGSLVAGPASTRYGRLPAMRLATIFFVAGPVFEASARTLAALSLGRLLSGVGAGAATVVVPVYIAETAPPDGKGFFGAATQVTINLGILLAQTLGYFLSRGQLWRVILGVAGAVGVVQAVGLLAVVESPRWLKKRGAPGRARKALESIRSGAVDVEVEIRSWAHASTGAGGGAGAGRDDGTDTDEDEHAALLRENGADAPRRLSTEHATTVQTAGLRSVLQDPHDRRAILVVIGVMLAQQLCGINAIMMYSVSILGPLLPTQSALIGVLICGINLMVTSVCAPLPDRIGRKACLLASIGGMGLNSLLLALSIRHAIGLLSALSAILFVAFFAVGLGPVPFILPSELVTPNAVAVAQSLALAASWTATFVVAQFFPVLDAALGPGNVFFVFAGSAVLSLVFVVFFVPESRGKLTADDVWSRPALSTRRRVE